MKPEILLMEKSIKNMYKQNNKQAGQLSIVYYTDPLCCWSWAFEPHWKAIRQVYEGNMNIRYCMGGLIESWQNYYDPVNAVTKPIQMGPVWMEVSHLTGVHIDNTIWVKDPPVSSYLACTAVKCAAMQSFKAGDGYLSMLREALMVHGKNISKQSTLINIAEEFAAVHTGFNMSQFRDDLVNGEGFKAFASDLQEIRYKNISRFPTLVINQGNKPGILITGYKPYEAIINAITEMA